MRSRKFWAARAAALFALSAPLALLTPAQAEDKPKEIRLANPGVGVGNRPYVGGSSWAVMHLRGMLEEEFKKDGIKITWTFLRGAGPAVNELYANGLVDFSLLGDLPSIAGRSGGLKTRVLAATGIRSNTYLAVPADSSITSIKDLKGKRVAIFKGTNLQLAAAKVLESSGLTEKDIRALNMDFATSTAALTTGDVDAAFLDNRALAMRDQGVVRVIYQTAGDPRFLRHASLVGSEEFIKKYPSVTQRVVKTLVASAKWASDQEKNPNVVYQLWAKSGVRYNDYKEDLRGQSLKLLSSPLLDPYFLTQYKQQITQAKKYGLIRNPFPLEQWVEPRFLNQALKELGLENYWPAADESGNVPSAPAATAAKAPEPPTATAN